jgi:L-fucose isomerase-like protein
LEAATPCAISSADLLPKDKARVRLVFSHIPPTQATWPNIGYDYESRKKELTAKLTAACPGVEFVPATAQNADQARKMVAENPDIDGYVVYTVGIWTGVANEIAASGKPTLMVDDLYGGSGEFLIAYAAAQRKGLKVAGVSSSKIEDAAQAVRALECLKKMRSSVVLDITGRETLWGNPEAIQAAWGTKVQKLGADDINQAYSRTDAAEAERWAGQWIRQAKKVVEPTREEIIKSGRMLLAMHELMRQAKAPALTIDCLTLFYGGKLPAYPCLGLFQFNNSGLVGACEGDLPSTLTMLLMTYFVGRPGYISDPVIDTSKNQIIYAHCVAPSKVYGPQGPDNPYHIRNHSEDRKGAAVRSLMPLGHMTTTILFNADRKEVVLHQGKSVENVAEDKACRTKLAVEVKGDINKLLTEWDRWGWHRVTFYGDLRRPVEILSALMGFKVVLEA